MDNNPYLKLDDPFEKQRNQIGEVQRETIEFQRLCYEVFFANKDGERLLEILTERYLLSALFSPTQSNASELALYFEGFKSAIRGLYEQGLIHKKRSNGGMI